MLSDTSSELPLFPQVKQKLLEAALHLCATECSLSRLGLRELARAAGLNPNTFYRHFKDMDDLGLTLVAQLGDTLRAAMRGARRATSQGVIRHVMQTFYDFVLEHPEAFLVGVREFHAGTPLIRSAMTHMMYGAAQEMAEDARPLFASSLFTHNPIQETLLLELSQHVVQYLFFSTPEYIEQVVTREAQLQRAERFTMLLFLGAGQLRM